MTSRSPMPPSASRRSPTTPLSASRRSLALAGLAVLLAAAAGCRTTSAESRQSAQNQLVDARQEYRQTIDALYRAYGGTDVPSAASSVPPAPGEPQGGGDVVGHVVSEADRSYFERQCVAVGRGERPFNVSSKMQTFLDSADNAKACRKAADLQARIHDLEQRVSRS